MSNIKQITVEYGLTVNIGNYSNVKPRIELVAEISEGDSFEAVLVDMLERAKGYVQAIADDELEKCGDKIKYSDEPLYCVWSNSERRCIVLAFENVQMPQEKNWKVSDNWRQHGSPQSMREKLAIQTWGQLLGSKHGTDALWVAIDCRDGSLDKLPPLPDAGPEPIWHQKNLKYELSTCLRLPEETWEEIGALGHVNQSYLGKLHDQKYALKLNGKPADELITWIKTHFDIVEPEPEPDPDKDYDDDYNDEDEDD